MHFCHVSGVVCVVRLTVYGTRHLLLCVCVLHPGTFPLDTTKTRLQVQGQLRDGLCRQSRYRGMTHALMHIAREEGVRALYGGYVVCNASTVYAHTILCV